MKITSTQYHDEAAETYDNDYQYPYWKIYNEITWNYIKDFLPADKNKSLILDAGGGTGLWSIKLAKLGYRVVLADISEGMLKVAERKIAEEGLSNRIQIIKADIVNMKSLQDNAFDLILAEGDSVSYCDSPEKAISELSRTCKNGGYVTASVDNKLNWVKRNMNKCNFAETERILESGIAMMQAKEDAAFPAFTFTIEELSDLFRKHNVNPVRTIGKPVFVNKQNLNDESVYNTLLEYELKYSSRREFAAMGGHIAVVGQKK